MKSLIRSASEIKRDIAADAGWKAVYEEQRGLADYWMEHFSDSPDMVSGWGIHSLVCPDCTGNLKYDRDRPHEHVCEVCGAAHDSQDMHESWVSLRRHDILGGIGGAALVYYVEGDEAYQAFVIRALTYYADHYHLFEEHGRWVGSAKLMGQTLDESIWGIRAVQDMITARIDPASPEALHIKKKLLVPMARLILSQPTNLMNISLWHAAFATGVGVYYKDSTFLFPYWKPHRRSNDGSFEFSWLYERNGARLLMENLTEDGLWRENSISYHYYALSAGFEFYNFLNIAEFDEDDEIGRQMQAHFQDERLVRSMVKAYVAPLQLLYDNGDMPATSDGWKYSLASIVNTYIPVYRVFKDQPERDVLAAVVHSCGEPPKNLTSLLHGIPENPNYDLFGQGSVHLKHNRMAMLRSGDINVFFKYGNLCAGHSHPDALELSIFPIAEDPGSINYGLPIHGEYFYVGGSHSTFMIDGKSQFNGAKDCDGEMSEDGLSISGEIRDTFPGVVARRSVSIEGSRIEDLMEIDCERPRQMDWLFHGVGDFTAQGEWIPDTLPEKTDGFKHFREVKRLTGGELKARWRFEGYQLDLSIPAMEGAAIYVAQTPDNPTDRIRHAIVVRKVAESMAVPAHFALTKYE